MPYVVGSEVVGIAPDGRRVWVRGRELFAELAEPEPGAGCSTFPTASPTRLRCGCGIAGLTAWLAVAWRAPVRPDDTVLVLGASGALGAVAVQAAKLLGASA